jgi:hypothetical protein
MMAEVTQQRAMIKRLVERGIRDMIGSSERDIRAKLPLYLEAIGDDINDLDRTLIQDVADDLKTPIFEMMVACGLNPTVRMYYNEEGEPDCVEWIIFTIIDRDMYCYHTHLLRPAFDRIELMITSGMDMTITSNEGRTILEQLAHTEKYTRNVLEREHLPDWEYENARIVLDRLPHLHECAIAHGAK